MADDVQMAFKGSKDCVHMLLYQSHKPTAQDVKSQGALSRRVLCNYLPVDDQSIENVLAISKRSWAHEDPPIRCQ